MSNQTTFNASSVLTGRDPSIPRGHPMRGTLRERIQDEHLRRREENESTRQMIIRPRDVVISIVGGISALIPLVIAFQSIIGG